MNTQANILRNAVETKRQELIKMLSTAGYHGLSDGRTLHELALSELQSIFRQVGKK